MTPRATKLHALSCRGCGEALPPQRRVGPGNLVRFHAECQIVRRKWLRCGRDRAQLARYRQLRAAGLAARVAQRGMSSPLATEMFKSEFGGGR